MDMYAELRELRPDLFEPIPLVIGQTSQQPEGYPNGAVDGWRDVESPDFIAVEECGEPLVNIANLKPPIFTTGDYSAKLTNSGYADALDGATLAQYVRQGVAEQLLEAQRRLPENYRLVMFDAWRSLETQYATYEMCYQSLVDRLVAEGVLSPSEVLTPETQELISKETQKFISLPSPLPDNLGQSGDDRVRARRIPSPHNTGGSVDLCIVRIDESQLDRLRELEAISAANDNPFSPEKAKANFAIAMIYREHAQLPDFGTAFDFAGAQAGLTYCETNDSLGEEPRDSRRMLYNVMTSVGFEPYAEEWWHFNSGNQMAERTKYYRTGQKGVARYGNSGLSPEQHRHEHIHRQLFHFLGEVAQNPAAAQHIPEDLRMLGGSPEDILELAAITGDPREATGFVSTHDMKYRGDIPEELRQAVKAAQS